MEIPIFPAFHQNVFFISCVIQTVCTIVSARFITAPLVQGGKAQVPKEENYPKNGDMIMVSPKNQIFKAALSNSGLWPNGIVPYTLAAAAQNNPVKRNAILKGIESYNTWTCIRFIPRTNEPNYVNFIDGNGCYSFVGRTGGAQDLSLGPTCDLFHGTVLHEMGHALGLIHEHQRPDRDNYVTVNYPFITQSVQVQYEKYPASQVNDIGFVYDYGSMMHYSPSSGSIYWLLPTMITKDPAAQFQIGQRSGFSLCDVEKINKLYGCDAYRSYNPTCLNSVPNVPRCSSFETSSSAPKSLMYRLWNAGTKDHFYTSKTADRDQALTSGYTTESMAGRCATTSTDNSCSCLTELYRLWHKGLNNHFYTVSGDQAATAVKNGYETEPVDCYCVKTQSCGATLPLYRFHNTATNDHFYTTTQSELETVKRLGYKDEGIECYLWR